VYQTVYAYKSDQRSDGIKMVAGKDDTRTHAHRVVK